MEMERSGRCPRCNTPTTAGLRYCPTCGLKLGAPDAGASPAPAADPFLARVRAALLNEYDVAREIGRGGMAAVFLAQDLRLPRRVALKVMLPELAYSPVMPQRFVGEARTAAMLDHPNIVPVFHAGEQDGLRYFAMRYIDGCSLERLQRARGPLPVTLACHLIAEIAAALDYAHSHGVVHRDVKPANVMIDRRFGRAIVTDFGIARIADGQRLTGTGLAIGTPEYMSPEQYASEDVTGASDQYALGAVAFQLLTGRPPFVGSQAEVLLAHVRQTPPSLRALRPDVPPLVETLVMRMLAKAPADRWPSLGELAARFTEHVGSAALALPAQLIALLPEPTAEEKLEQTPVSPAAGLSRPQPSLAAPAATPVAAPVPPVAPPAPAPATPPEPLTAVTTSERPALRETAFTPGVAADEPWEVPTRSATFAGYRPVAPAEPEPVAPARGGAGRWLVAGGGLAAVVAAVVLFGGDEDSPPPAAADTVAAANATPAATTQDTASGAVSGDPATLPDSAGVAAADSVAAAPVAVRELRISPSARNRPELAPGDSLRLTARLFDPMGRALSFVDAVRWTSSAPAVATVSPDGVVRALAVGRPVTITASIPGATAARATIRVRERAAAAPAAEPPKPRIAAVPSAEQADRLLQQVVGLIDGQRVEDLRPLLGGPAAGQLLDVMRKEKNVQASAEVAAAERAGDGATVPVRLAVSWQKYLLGRMNGRHNATAELVARLEPSGDGWRVAGVQALSFVRR